MQHSRASMLLKPNGKYVNLENEIAPNLSQHDQRGETGPNPAEAGHMCRQQKGIGQKRAIQGHHDGMGHSQA